MNFAYTKASHRHEGEGKPELPSPKYFLPLFEALSEMMGSIQGHIPQCQIVCWEHGEEKETQPSFTYKHFILPEFDFLPPKEFCAWVIHHEGMCHKAWLLKGTFPSQTEPQNHHQQDLSAPTELNVTWGRGEDVQPWGQPLDGGTNTQVHRAPAAPQSRSTRRWHITDLPCPLEWSRILQGSGSAPHQIHLSEPCMHPLTVPPLG